MLDVLTYKGRQYPAFQREGAASQYAIPFARQVCKGVGVDIGCGRIEWAFPGALPVDPGLNGHTAMSFPYADLDYVFSSHCLEHLDSWVDALDYWTTKLRPGGVLFLYLPDYSQEYWRPWNNRKHRHVLCPGQLADYLREHSYAPVFCSGVDLNNSFMVMAERGIVTYTEEVERIMADRRFEAEQGPQGGAK